MPASLEGNLENRQLVQKDNCSRDRKRLVAVKRDWETEQLLIAPPEVILINEALT